MQPEGSEQGFLSRLKCISSPALKIIYANGQFSYLKKNNQWAHLEKWSDRMVNRLPWNALEALYF